MRAQEQLARRRDPCRPEVDGAANPARELARKIGRTIPFIYGGGGLGAVAAMRWKCDVTRTPRRPRSGTCTPSSTTTRSAAWGQHGDVDPPDVHDRRAAPRLRAPAPRGPVRATREIIDEACTRCSTVEAEGEGRLAQLLDLMYVGDWASCYLALDNDVDPGPIDAIYDLKSRLRTAERARRDPEPAGRSHGRSGPEVEPIMDLTLVGPDMRAVIR